MQQLYHDNVRFRFPTFVAGVGLQFDFTYQQMGTRHCCRNYLLFRHSSCHHYQLEKTQYQLLELVRYIVDGKVYTKSKWINAGDPVPKVGSSVRVMYNSDKPSKSKIL